MRREFRAHYKRCMRGRRRAAPEAVELGSLAPASVRQGDLWPIRREPLKRRCGSCRVPLPECAPVVDSNAPDIGRWRYAVGVPSLPARKLYSFWGGPLHLPWVCPCDIPFQNADIRLCCDYTPLLRACQAGAFARPTMVRLFKIFCLTGGMWRSRLIP